MTSTILADSSWTPGNTVALGSLLVAAIAIVAGPLLTRRVMRSADRQRWERDKRTDAFATLMTIHAARNAWRKGANHDPDTHPVEVGVMPVLLLLFGDFKAEKLALVAAVAHRQYRIAVETLRSDVAANRALTVTQAQLRQFDEDASAAEWAFYEQARRDLGLDSTLDTGQDTPEILPVMGARDRGPTELGL